MKAAPVALLASLLLSGCTALSGGTQAIPDPGDVAVTDSTGGIRGVVVDQAIRPLKGATVTVTGPGVSRNLTTDENGGFTLAGLKPGVYLVKASKPLYDSQQQSVVVEAGVAPPVLKVQLTQVVFAKPYLQTTKFKGFIACSGNYVVVLSEECGEGVGSPRNTCDLGPPPCLDNPVMPGERIGHQDNNHVQYDFSVDGPFVKTLVIEQAWTPSSEAGKAFYTPVSIDWACTPSCDGKTFLRMEGLSPLLGRAEFAEGGVLKTSGGAVNVTAATKLSTFTWASPESTGVLLNQEFEVFVSAFYHLPAPEGWSFIAHSPDPFA